MKEKQSIYIMTNPCLPNTVKIGCATDIEERRKLLSTPDLASEYEVYAVYTETGIEEDDLLEVIKKNRPDLLTSGNPEDVYNWLRVIAFLTGSEERLKRIKHTDLTHDK